MNYNGHLPQTIEQAVGVLLERLSEGEKINIASMSRDDLINLHFGLGTSIRNDFGLWGGNTALLENTGKSHPDDAAMAIIEALWHRLVNARSNHALFHHGNVAKCCGMRRGQTCEKGRKT